MQIDLIVKIAIIGILVAVLHVILTRSGREDQAMMVTLAAIVVVLAVVVQELNGLFNMIKSLFGL